MVAVAEPTDAPSLGSLCRLDDNWLNRVEREDRLGRIAVRALLIIVVGAGAYGFTFGLWRGPAQALNAAIKLPAVLLLAGAFTLGANAILGTLLGARLSLVQATVALLLALAIIATTLGAMAPISLLFVLNAPSPSPDLVGLDPYDPGLAPALYQARMLLLWHVAIIGVAGLSGVTRLRALLHRLIPNAAAAQRVLWSWLVLVGLAGAELSWLLRPFLGKPHLPETFFRQQALQGNFFEEIATIAQSSWGTEGAWAALLLCCVTAVSTLIHLRGVHTQAQLKVIDGGVMLNLGSNELFVRWAELGETLVRDCDLLLVRHNPSTLSKERYSVRFDTPEAASIVGCELEVARHALAEGPFRTAGQ